MNIRLSSIVVIAVILQFLVSQSPAVEVTETPGNQAVIRIVDADKTAGVLVDDADYPVVKLAAGFLADDIERVSGKRPAVLSKPQGDQLIIAGTIGHSGIVDDLIASGKLHDIEKIKGKWEGTLLQIVDHPIAGVDQALVIVGSDRRGTAYGLMQISEKIGVSPWYWWADVPVAQHDKIYLSTSGTESDSPAVKYRGIFINDEDWGLHQWAKTTFEPAVGGIGPKTYEKVFELMLRLRLNYIWPAMHACSKEFHSIPENIEIADRYGIVAGASHCEPMLYNNVKWDAKKFGAWDYSTNRDKIYSVWEQSAKSRGDKEAVWTLGIRGIHDAGMQGPKDMPGRMKILDDVFKDQQSLLDQYASKNWGPISKAFVPYKEVLPIYDAGLKVPDDVTLVWVDDNFGYIRRLSNPEEQKRSGGAGVYWHLSYYGGPHSYTWINATAPAKMWTEFHKAWENNARNLWVINVGDIKPMEIGIDYFSKLAWKPDQFSADSQPEFLRSFARQQFGEKSAAQIGELLGRYYRLGTIRKPELMNRAWAMSLTENKGSTLSSDYNEIAEMARAISKEMPAESKDAYLQLVQFPVEIMKGTGSIFLADRQSQMGAPEDESKKKVDAERANLEKMVEQYNQCAGGKWKNIMPGLVTGKDLPKWSSQVRWPWGESPTTQPVVIAKSNRDSHRMKISAQQGSAEFKWTPVDGLGASGNAAVLLPARGGTSWQSDDSAAPYFEIEFTKDSDEKSVVIDFLPTLRIFPGLQQRVAVRIDNQKSQVIEVPGSSGKEDENGKIRSDGIQNNSVRVEVELPELTQGKHVLRIQGMDPGVAIDGVSTP